MKTLIEKAKEIGEKRDVNQNITPEQYELGVAWAKGEVSLRQMQKVLGYNNVNSAYGFLSKCFKYSILKSNKK